MSQTKLNQHSSLLEVPRDKLVQLYDELSEVVALNNFLYDAFLSMTEGDDLNLEANTTQGLAAACRWLKYRQDQLKRQAKHLTE